MEAAATSRRRTRPKAAEALRVPGGVFQLGLHRLPSFWRRIGGAVARARRAEPLEFDQILVRFAVGFVITTYVALSQLLEEPDAQSAAVIIALLLGAWSLGAGFLAHLALWPQRRLERRTVSICTDAIALSLLIGFGEKSAAMFFPIYLWVTLGNGFRFGIGYMYGAIAANAGCFVVMAALTPYWRDAWQFSTGLTLAIVAIPFYVAKLIRNLRTAMTEAEAASRAKTEFLSMMSHELRTPLNAIMGLAQLSRLTATSTKERFSAVSTELAAGRLLRMVDTILNFQRIESGAAERRDREFDVLDMLAEVKAIIEPLARQKGLDFRIRFASALPAALVSDPDHIQTIIFNLATNAVKYTRSGRVSLTLGLGRDRLDPELLIEVRDTGDGISPEARSRIFDRFVRGDDHRALAEPGVGLGLSMCRSLAELLGGSIGCESVVGEGSYFWARVPVTTHAGVSDMLAPVAPVLWLTPPDTAPGLRDTEITLPAEGAPPLGSHVLIIDIDRAGSEAKTRLEAILAREEQPPALIVLSQAADPPGQIAAAATAIVTAPMQRDLDGIIATAARWHGRVTQQFAVRPAEAIPLIRRLTVLVADDNALNRDVTQRMLELDGHRIILAETGAEALRRLLEDEAEVAFLDVNMPGMSGIEVCRAYKTGLGSGARITVIGLTADVSEHTRQDCLRAGMAAVLGKPVTLEQLRGALANMHAAPAKTVAARAETEEPVVDEDRIAFVRQLFGEDRFNNHFLASFKRDVVRNLELLRQGVAARRRQSIGDALHAIKSSACTAGAKRLFRTVEQLEGSDYEGDASGAELAIQTEYRRFCEAVEAVAAVPEDQLKLAHSA
jgi:two-component system, sensor histidine kinase RpfC